MAKFKVHTLNVTTTSTGKKKADCELIDESGVMTRATIWGDFQDFQNITFGSIVEGDLVPAKDPKYGPTLYPPKPVQSPVVARSGGFGGGMTKLMDKKSESIAQAQGNKEHSIKEASSMTNAVNLAIAEYGTFSGEEHLRPTLDFLITKYRKWILDHWDIPVNLKPPF